MSEQPPRSVLDMSGGQAGDVSASQVASSITNAGASPDRVLALLEQYLLAAGREHTEAITDLRGELTILSDALRGLRETVNWLGRELDRSREAEAQRLLAEHSERKRRQRDLNLWLAVLTAAAVLMTAGWLYLLWRLWPTLTAAALAAWGTP